MVTCDEFIVLEGERIRFIEGRPASGSEAAILTCLDTQLDTQLGIHVGNHVWLRKSDGPAPAGYRKRCLQARPFRLASADRPADPDRVPMRGGGVRDL